MSRRLFERISRLERQLREADDGIVLRRAPWILELMPGAKGPDATTPAQDAGNQSPDPPSATPSQEPQEPHQSA